MHNGIPDLLDYVDKKRLQFTVAVDISYIDKEIQTWFLGSLANIWVPLCCHPLFGDVNQRKGGKRNNLSQTCKHELAETVFNSISYS